MNIWSNERDDGAATMGEIEFQADDTIRWKSESAAGANIFDRQTNAVFRDPAAWYHVVCVCDSNQTDSTSADIYVNGVVQTYSSTTNPGSAQDLGWPSTSQPFEVGKFTTAAHYLDGYLAHFYFIDGQKLTPSDFGETNSTTGQWVPKAYGGTFGNAGLFLDFSVAPGTGDGAGTDSSGNDNDLTDSGLAAADQVTDSPTDNYCVFNLLDTNDSPTFAEGNLEYTGTAAAANCRGTVGVDINDGNGYYFEILWVSSTANCDIGIQEVSANINTFPTSAGGNAYMIASYDGNKRNNGSDVSYGTSYSTGDIFQVAMKGGKIWFGKNNTWQASGDPAGDSNEAFSSVTGIYAPAVMENNTDAPCVFVADFGQSGFEYTPPSGFVALSTANIATPTIADPSAYFQPTIYTGNGSTQSIDQGGNSTFEPDFVWIKNRDATDSHVLTDSVRGVTKLISSDAGTAETTDADTLTAFDSDGFSLGDDDKVNTNTEKYVGWQWLESATPGFDIVSFTGNGSNRTISHSLGAVPELMIVKNLDTEIDWAVYHASTGNTHYLTLNSTAVSNDNDTYWNDTTPTSSVFTVGTHNSVNKSSSPMIAYLWAGVEGFSKFGSYTGNGSTDGPFVSLGFSPSFIMIKETSGTGGWFIFDDARDPTNDNTTERLYADTNGAGVADTGGASKGILDFLSSGFKLRDDGSINTSSDTYVFMAFSETPFKTAPAR